MPRSSAASCSPRFLLDALCLSRGNGIPINRQLYEQLSALVLDQALPARTRLPSSRYLAKDLGVSRNTVMATYAQLEAEGYIETIQGSGSFVSDLPLARHRLPQSDATGGGLQLARLGEVMTNWTTPNTGPPGRPSFLPGAPNLSQFPFHIWRRVIARRLRSDGEDLFGYHHPTGYPPLKEAIARHLETSRGVLCDPEQIVITGGAQGAFDLLARLLLNPDDAVWMEEPGYPGAQGSFTAAGAKLVPLRVGPGGWDLRPPAGPIRLIYVTPSCQCPLGVTMRPEQRFQLIDIARQKGAWILEDDFDGEYRFSGRSVPAMQGIDPSGRTIHVGTFSKTIFPSLRLGFMVLPLRLAEAAQRAMFLTGHSPPLILQGALADFISEGHFATHLARIRRVFAKRRELFQEHCAAFLGEWLKPMGSESGIQALWMLDEPWCDQTVAKAARGRAITVTSLSSHYLHGPSRSGLIFGYTALPEMAMKSELGRMRETFHSIVGSMAEAASPGYSG
jgi:GntR family transcriptional regulator / MocR family aminotransferase